MKHTKLIATALLSVLLVGCSSDDVKAVPTDYNDTIGDIIMKNIYDDTLTSVGYSAMFDELLNQIIIQETIETRRSGELYERLNDEITSMIQKDSSFIEYGKYEKNVPVTQYFADGKPREYGVFDDNGVAEKLRADGYNLTCDGSKDVTKCKIWDAETILTDDKVVNTYVTKILKPKVLKAMLNDEYIVARKSSYFTSTQFRRIETVYVDFESKDEVESTRKLYQYQDALMNGTKTFEQIEDDWQSFKVSVVNDEIAEAEANTDKKEEMLSKYVCNDVWEVCKNQARKAADEKEYYEEDKIFTNTSTIVNSNITSRIFSSSIISNPDNIKLYLYEDPTNPTGENVKTSDKWYYLKTYVDEPLPVDSIINTEGGKNYFIRIQFLNDLINSSFLNSTAAADVKLKYEIAKVLAEKSSNLSGNILYYLNKYKITIHDQEFLDYVKDQYDYPEDAE